MSRWPLLTTERGVRINLHGVSRDAQLGVSLESSINHGLSSECLGPGQCQGWVNVGDGGIPIISYQESDRNRN